MRNPNIGKRMTLVAVVWTVGSFALQTPAFAQGKCQEVKATWIDIYNGGNTTSGTITNGGALNGTTLTVFNTGAFPTSEPTIVSYAGDLSLTTNHGRLNTRNVYIYDFATGRFTIMGRVNPNTSTGRFAGATGTLFIAGKTIGAAVPFTYPSEITGEICFVNE